MVPGRGPIQIERVQYQAVLGVTGTWNGTNSNKIYEELGWEVFLIEDLLI